MTIAVTTPAMHGPPMSANVGEFTHVRSPLTVRRRRSGRGRQRRELQTQVLVHPLGSWLQSLDLDFERG